MWHHCSGAAPLHEGRVDSVFSQAASRVLGRCFLAAEQECWSPPPSLRVLCHSCCVCLKREDADACRVHPAQWLFPPNTAVLADVRHRLEPAEPHLPHLHHVRSHSASKKIPAPRSTSWTRFFVFSRRDSDDAVEPIGSLPGQAR